MVHAMQHVVDAPPLSTLADQVRASDVDGNALDFALCLALNHTVVLEEDPKTGQTVMQAESPDEEALVDGGKVLVRVWLIFFVSIFVPRVSLFVGHWASNYLLLVIMCLFHRLYTGHAVVADIDGRCVLSQV